jgi:hypothetical protein
MNIFKTRSLLAVAAVTLALAALPRFDAAAAEPLSGSCSAEKFIRVLEDRPSCSFVVQCPSEGVDCLFAAKGGVSSAATVATAQGRMRLTAVGTGSFVDFTCSSRAAIIATGAGSSCEFPTQSFLLGPGTRIATTCTWMGDTISVNARVDCAAAFLPLDGE